MALGDHAARREFTRTYGLFAVGVIVFIIVLAVLSHLGLPDVGLGALFAIAVIAIPVVVGVVTRTMRIEQFLVANHMVPAAHNGMAIAGAFLAGAAYLGLAGAYFEAGDAALAIAIGWVLGFTILAVAVMPAFRQSGAATVPEFLALRFDSRPIRLVGAIVVIVASFAGLAAAIAAAAFALTRLVDVSVGTSIVIVLAAVLFATLLGGMRALSLATIAQYLVLAVAFVVPVAIISYRQSGFPIPQFTYGYALRDAAAIMREGALAAGPAGHFLPFATRDSFNLLALIVSLAAGTASLAHVVMRGATTPGVATARRSVVWALLCVLVVVLTAPAYAAFARLGVLNALSGVGLDALPDWVFTFGRLGLVKLCGHAAVSPEAVRAACVGLGGGTLAPRDIALGGDAVVLALPAIADLPPMIAALAAAGALAAALAAAAALAFAIATAVGHDLYFGLADRIAPVGRRLIIMRLALIAAAGLAAWMAGGGAVFTLAAAGFALAAAGNFPALIFAIWWKGCTASGALAGMIAGFATTLLTIAVALWTGPTPWPFFGLPAGIAPAGAAILGLPAGFLVALAVSLLAPQPPVGNADPLGTGGDDTTDDE